MRVIAFMFGIPLFLWYLPRLKNEPCHPSQRNIMRVPWQTAFAFTILLVSLHLPAVAQNGEKQIVAYRTPVPPRIDGVPDDEQWRHAEPATEFTQRDPDEGAPSSEGTEVRVLYDDAFLYFGCRMDDSDPSKIVARLTRRDNEIESDRFSIRIDSYHDHQTAYEFTFNAAGVKVDILQFDDGDREDESWDPVWDLETDISSTGWTAEVRIPLHMLRYRIATDDADGTTWGINFIRHISRKQETSYWAFIPKNESGFISRFGHLTGLRELPHSRSVELLPFVLGRQRYLPATSVRPRTISFDADGGLDVRLGLWSNFTLSATVNPDFGQVEADPAVLNLSTFETFYPERRPFFVEGTQIIRFSTWGDDNGPGMFYTRRIGRAISPDEIDVPEGGSLIDAPSAATIVGAAKLTGKTEGGLSIGVLQAMTNDARATLMDSTGRQFETVVDPKSYFSIVRVRQDVLDNSNVGMILTTVARDSRAPAFTGGWDWNLRLSENTYQLDGFLALSHTSNRDRRPISGSAGRITFNRTAARHWFWGLSADFTSKFFNINDAGFFRRPNDFGFIGNLRYAENKPGDLLRSYSLGLSLHERRNFDGVNLGRSASIETEGLLPNYWSVETGAGIDVGLYDDRETRGNGLYRRPSKFSLRGELSNDERSVIVCTLEQEWEWSSLGGATSATELSMAVKPLTWMDWNVEVNYAIGRDVEAWVTNIESAGELRSIFGDRKTDELGCTIRTNITFARNLTLQLYGQMFVAKGLFDRTRELVGQGDFAPFTVQEDNRSFSEREFHTNAVLRWEYLPGSTLFLVWSQARGDEEGIYYSRFSQDISRTFELPPANILLLKVSYWWSL